VTSKLIAEFTVDGIPKGQPRPRAFSRGGKARIFDSGTAEGWKGQIALAVRPLLPPTPLEGPIELKIVFRMPRAKRLMRKKDPAGPLPHLASPDVDNLLKAVMDCLTMVGLWRDDTQVIRCTAAKQYHAKDGRPGADIRIEEVIED